MTKVFSIVLKKGGLSPGNFYLPVPKELREILPRSVFGGDGPANPAPVPIKLRVGTESFETDIPSKHPSRFKSRPMARRIIELLDLKENDVLVLEEEARLVFRVTKAEPGPGGAGRPPSTGKDDAKDIERRKRLAEVLARPQQAAFRHKVAERDGWICAVSGCVEPRAMEAAHLHSVANGGNDDTANGIMLRADIHRLFDADLLTIDPATGEVAVSSDVTDSDHRALAGVIASTGADLTYLKARYK